MIMEMVRSMNNKGIFIVGCPRSGTTLLRQILDSHSQIAVVPESAFMIRLKQISFLYGNLNKRNNLINLLNDIKSIKRVSNWFPNIDIKEFAEEIIKKNKQVTIREVFCKIYEFYAKEKNKFIWADKTPENLLQINQIKTNFPKAKIIIVIRDGRDVALSLKKVGMAQDRSIFLRLPTIILQKYRLPMMLQW